MFFSCQDRVRNQDSVGVLAGVTGSLEGRHMLWQFVQTNWPELYRRYSTSTMLSRLVQVGGRFSTLFVSPHSLSLALSLSLSLPFTLPPSLMALNPPLQYTLFSLIGPALSTLRWK